MIHHILFVCVRNRVRSVFAQYYLEKLLREKDETLAERIKISSAGLYPKKLRDVLDEAHVPPPDPFFDRDMSNIVRELMHKKGVASPDGWRSRQLTPENVSEADLIIVALPAQKEEISEQYPDACNKIFTFGEMAAFDESILFENFSGVTMDDAFWERSEENPPYVTNVIDEVEKLLLQGFPHILKQLGVYQYNSKLNEPNFNLSHGKEIQMPAVLYEKEKHIVTITLNRPERLNRIDAEIFKGCSDAFMNFRDDTDAWVAIVTAAGEAFSTGADHDRLLRQWADKSFDVPPMITRGLNIWKPIIAAVNGPARGGGVEIPLACDIRLASENATFQLPEVGRALIPGWGGTQRAMRMIPPAIAAEMIFMGTVLDAEEAWRIGLINKVVPLDQLLPTAKEWAAKICEKGPLAVRRAKEAMIRGSNMPLDGGLSLELAFFEEMLQSQDYQEGLSSLVEDRKPEYKGR